MGIPASNKDNAAGTTAGMASSSTSPSSGSSSASFNDSSIIGSATFTGGGESSSSAWWLKSWLILVPTIILLITHITTISSRADPAPLKGGDRTLNFNQEEETMPLPFGVEFEFIFPKEFAGILPPAARYPLVGAAINRALGISPRVPTTVYIEYYSAHNESPFWKVAPDASLVGPAGGFEVVSPVLTEVAEITKVIRAMQGFGAELSESTDFHVHIDVSGRDVAQIGRVYKHFIAYERALDSFQPPNHQGNNNPYLKSIRELFDSVSAAWDALDACKTVDCLVQTAQPGKDKEAIRAYKLNLAIHSSSDTTSLEFRGHHGTLDPETAKHWIRLASRMVQCSVDNTCHVPAKDNTLEGMMNALFPEDSETAKAFYRRRMAMIDAESKKPASLYSRKVWSMQELYGSYPTWHGDKNKPSKGSKASKGGGSPKGSKASKEKRTGYYGSYRSYNVYSGGSGSGSKRN
mmetsp:Transcript_16982/g.36851  ORF Transcript_16982/g.36851 Transcript_16982/m.36851 type:complete len:464 (+) Transcript_16982:172-1563(+)